MNYLLLPGRKEIRFKKWESSLNITKKKKIRYHKLFRSQRSRSRRRSNSSQISQAPINGITPLMDFPSRPHVYPNQQVS